MTDLSTPLDLQQTVDRYGTPDYSLGYAAPETSQSQDVPVLDTAVGAVVPEDAGHNSTTYATKSDTRRAQRGAPNDYGWRQQDRLEVGGYRETIVPLSPPAGGTIVLNADHATAWELTPAGSFTVAVEAMEPYDPPDPTAPAPYVLVSIVVFVRLQPGATINWFPGLRWSSSITASTFTAPTAQRDDCYLIVYSPMMGWVGHVISQGYK